MPYFLSYSSSLKSRGPGMIFTKAAVSERKLFLNNVGNDFPQSLLYGVSTKNIPI